MKWFQALLQNTPQHKYAINAVMLGDASESAWTNLGYWQVQNDAYPHACETLAQQLADAIDLNSKDRVLDLGCGQGASLHLWKSHYQVTHIEAVDIQPACVDKIIHSMPFIHNVMCGSFLNLNGCDFEFKFDAVLCIDAAYHSDLNSFLNSVKSVLNSKARIGFHYLVLTEKYATLNSFEKLKLSALLKSADIQLKHLNSYAETENIIGSFGFEKIQIENLSRPVLQGFADYIQQSSQQQAQKKLQGQWSLDRFKIEMTAKLCQKLYADGLVDYVQICAVNA
ncbi:SAM-dependent methyltransferase [Acinetobacter lanii]|uniref:Class I SAM-dependent methyltransferase n=1 Tax=Acinetobacter lanii TaxID=2715163 RepID=A0A6G8S0U5_9GAMM|nr:class I SAM-dependent methyltransferase [Acinetobacter lanii]QIO07751.1 class I SAM-dependent methyltransferase [Acinetobacter lanii]